MNVTYSLKDPTASLVELMSAQSVGFSQLGMIADVQLAINKHFRDRSCEATTFESVQSVVTEKLEEAVHQNHGTLTFGTMKRDDTIAVRTLR